MNLRSFLIVILSVLFCAGCRTQPASPYALEEGAYAGTNTMSSGTVTLTHNLFYGTQITPMFVNTSEPSPYGDMIVKVTGSNKGSYSFNDDKTMSGTWSYDAANDRLSFSGKLKDALKAYKITKDYYSLTFHIRTGNNEKDYRQYIYTKKTSTPKPPRAKPNGLLTGTMTIMEGDKTAKLLNVATGQTGQQFAGAMASTNAAMNTLTLTRKNSADYYELAFHDVKGKSVVWSSEKISTLGWTIKNYLLGVLDHSQSRMALIGTTYTGASYPKYPFDYKVAVVDVKSGRQLGELNVELQRYIKPAFFRDGRMLYSPAEGGMAVSTPQYNSYKRMYNSVVGCMALSPDEKTIVFNEGTGFYTINVDGTNRKAVICDGEALTVNDGKAVSDISYSPDGKYAGFTYGYGPSYYLIVFPLDGGPSTIIKNPYGEELVQNNPVMSWN